MAQYKIPPVGDCTDPVFQQELVDFHEISASTFVNMVLDFFEVFPFPSPYVVTRANIEAAITGINCEFEVMRMNGDFSQMNNADITYTIGIPLEHNYSIGLIHGILDRFPTALSFHFYKAFCPRCQRFAIIFQVWDGTSSLYNGDLSDIVP